MPIYFLRCFVGVLLVMLLLCGAAGQTLSPTALDAISSFVANFCGEYWREGQRTGLELKGTARAELQGLFRRLADLGVEGAGNVNIERYTGVLQNQLSRELQSVRECRLTLWTDLRNAIYDEGKPPNRGSAREPVALEKDSYTLSEDGIRLQNSSLGPFCCTGRGIIIRSKRGDPVGYAYFFAWDGQAYNVQGGSIVPDQNVLVSGARDLGDLKSEQVENKIEFNARQPNVSSDWVRAGALEYRAVLLNFELARREDRPYFKMGSLNVRLNVRLAK